jgi:hypothetical protein
VQFYCHARARRQSPAPRARGRLWYNEVMARGWESKAVEAQIETAEARAVAKKSQLTPEEMERARLRESLLLSRARVLKDLEQSRNPRYRKMLADALAHLDAKLAQLD